MVRLFLKKTTRDVSREQTLTRRNSAAATAAADTQASTTFGAAQGTQIMTPDIL